MFGFVDALRRSAHKRRRSAAGHGFQGGERTSRFSYLSSPGSKRQYLRFFFQRQSIQVTEKVYYPDIALHNLCKLMKVRGLITIRKNHKNRKFQSQIVELCRSGIFSERQLLDELRISRTSLRVWHRRYARHRQRRWHPIKNDLSMRSESEQLKVLRQRLAASEKEINRLKLKNEGLEIMIDIAENQLKVPIRKKSGSGG